MGRKKLGEFIKCKACSKSFYKSLSESKRGNKQYCSRGCYLPILSERIKKERNSLYKNGRVRSSTGYIWIAVKEHPYARMPGHYVFEHRLIIEEYLGRYLKPTEEVHHLNSIKTDNRLENLQLFSSHAEHMKAEAKMGKFKKSYEQRIKLRDSNKLAYLKRERNGLGQFKGVFK